MKVICFTGRCNSANRCGQQGRCVLSNLLPILLSGECMLLYGRIHLSSFQEHTKKAALINTNSSNKNMRTKLGS